MKKVFDNMSNYIIVFNKERKIKYCNSIILNKLNYKLEELEDKSINEKLLYNNHIIKDLDENFKLISENENIYELITKEKNIIELRGKVLQTMWNSEEVFFMILDEYSELYKRNSIIKNLKSELDEAITKYIESEEQISLLLESTTDLLAFIDKEGNILRAGSEWKKCLGWDEDDFKVLKWQDLFHPDEVADALKIARSCRGENNVAKNVNRCRCKNGKYKVIYWKSTYIKDKDIYIGAGSDITVEKMLEQERKKYEEAFHSEYIKNEFLANISHEFKTPLNITLSAIQLINHGIKNGYIKSDNKFDLDKYINSIKQNSYRLLRLVNNILDVSKIDMGYYNVNLENCNIVYLIEDIITTVVNYIEGKNISITFDTEFEEIIVACDKEKIERIVLNLISNAIKYTSKDKSKQGKIYINLNLYENFVRVSIKDNGIGIPKEQCESIFNKFKRIDTTFNRQVEGSGIGLSLVKALIELQGGSIEVYSEVGQGTEFIFYIPIGLVDEENISSFDITGASAIEKCDVEFSDIYDF